MLYFLNDDTNPIWRFDLGAPMVMAREDHRLGQSEARWRPTALAQVADAAPRYYHARTTGTTSRQPIMLADGCFLLDSG